MTHKTHLLPPPEFQRQNLPPLLPQPPNLCDFFLDNHIPPPPPIPPPLLPQPRNLTFKNDIKTNTTQTFSGDCLIEELERVIEKEKPKKTLVPDGDIVFSLPKLPTILDNEDFEKKKNNLKSSKEINDEIDLQRLHDEIITGEIPKEI